MRRKTRLDADSWSRSTRACRNAAIACWLAFILLVALLWGEDRIGVLHPHPAPLLLLLALLLVSTLGSVVAGGVLCFRYRSPGAGLGIAALALLPMALLALGGERAAAAWSQRSVQDSALLRMAQCAGAAMMEAQADVFYPHQIQSPRLVMRYRSLATPDRDFREMDAHIARLEHLLGRRLHTPIHWVRGSLLGQSGVSYLGLALGSEHSPPDWSGRQTDRHELAHAVIRQMIPPVASPPTLLSEGWAEAQSGETSRELAQSAANWQANGEGQPLRALLGPDWYYRDRGAVYSEGGSLVDFVLRRYGAARFLQLYTKMRPNRADATVREVLGLNLEALERTWRDDASMRAGAGTATH